MTHRMFALHILSGGWQWLVSNSNEVCNNR